MTLSPVDPRTESKPEEIRIPSGRIIATGVSFDDYMEQYAAQSCEWVDGMVIAMTPVIDKHVKLTQYSIMLFNAYFAYHAIGQVYDAPFVMKLERAREPDIQVILNDNPHPLQRTMMNGPADICVEVVSEESIERDHGEKFREYEKGGVREYWIFDPLHEECRFYHLDENGIYRVQYPDAEGYYRTPLLPDFALNVPVLWQTPLPNFLEIAQFMAGLMAKSKPAGS